MHAALAAAVRALGSSRKLAKPRTTSASGPSVIGRQRLRKSRCISTGQRSNQLLLLVLELIETVINPVQRKQFLMRPLLAQTPLMKHKYAIRVLNRTQPMRDHHRRAPLQQSVQ